MERQRLIFHIDVNSAFLSWESVYRLSKDPHAIDLANHSSAAGGDAKSRHGIVLAKSVPAKQYGISTAEPLVSALKKCPELTIVPSRFDLYLEYSEKLIKLFEEYTLTLRNVSIDEVLRYMTETIHLFGSPTETANRTRGRIHRSLVYCQCRHCPQQASAKMASDFEKPDKTHTLFSSEIPDKMWPLPLRNLFFVGSSAAMRMEKIGLIRSEILLPATARF